MIFSLFCIFAPLKKEPYSKQHKKQMTSEGHHIENSTDLERKEFILILQTKKSASSRGNRFFIQEVSSTKNRSEQTHLHLCFLFRNGNQMLLV